MKPYQHIPIRDCGEALVPIPAGPFVLVDPHPYVVLGAPYGEASPYFLRLGVLQALTEARQTLTELKPGWQIQIFDAFRPRAVQQFMVDYAFQELLQIRQLKTEQLSAAQKRELMQEVLEFWALPSSDPATPSPHSTGAALDVTLVDEHGHSIDMGSPIDEVSPRSFPDHFGQSADPNHQKFHRNRTLLHQVMTSVGFRRHPKEWWHFSLGDQFWAWLWRQETGQNDAIAKYGGVSVPGPA